MESEEKIGELIYVKKDFAIEEAGRLASHRGRLNVDFRRRWEIREIMAN